MNPSMRLPTWKNCFEFFVKENIIFDDVIDVGAAHPSSEGFIKYFPKAKFHLIEPQLIFNEQFKTVYGDTAFDVYNVMIDKESYPAYLLEIKRYESINPTHTLISKEKTQLGWSDALTANIVSCSAINVYSLNDLFKNKTFGKNVLLKIDVDGQDLNVLEGSTDLLQKTLCVQVEVSLKNVMQIISFLDSKNFTLIDVVDPCYYDKRLTQLDLIFMNKNRIEEFSIFDTAFGRSSHWDNNLLFNYPYML